MRRGVGIWTPQIFIQPIHTMTISEPGPLLVQYSFARCRQSVDIWLKHQLALASVAAFVAKFPSATLPIVSILTLSISG